MRIKGNFMLALYREITKKLFTMEYCFIFCLDIKWYIAIDRKKDITGTYPNLLYIIK